MIIILRFPAGKLSLHYCYNLLCKCHVQSVYVAPVWTRTKCPHSVYAAEHRRTSSREGVSLRDVLVNRCPGCASGPGPADPAGTAPTLSPHHYHPSPDTVPGYCGDTSLAFCSSVVNKTDGHRKALGEQTSQSREVGMIQSYSSQLSELKMYQHFQFCVPFCYSSL